MSPSGSPAPVKWYYRPVWVLMLLFVFLGPLGLPYLWKSPGFSRSAKVVLTVAVVAGTALLLGEVIRTFRAIEAELTALGLS